MRARTRAVAGRTAAVRHTRVHYMYTHIHGEISTWAGFMWAAGFMSPPGRGGWWEGGMGRREGGSFQTAVSGLGVALF